MTNFNINDNIILTAIGSVITYLAAQKWLFPHIVKLWEWIKERKKQQDENNINATSEILEIKKNTLDVTEKQFEVLLNQISRLEEELQAYADELQRLRTTILRLNARLYTKSILLTKLQGKCCDRENCKDRIACKNYLCEIENQ